MEAKHPMSHVTSSRLSLTGIGAALGAVYLAVLPMASTIALRNLALVGLLVVLVTFLAKERPGLRPGWPLLLWGAFLLLFPVFSTDPSVAWQSLAGQWGRSVLALLAGAGLAILLYRSGWGTAFHLGVVTAVPILIHLVLIAWKTMQTGAVPWGDWGRETHHADLGYAAGQAAVLLAAVIVTAGQKFRLYAIALVAAALLSMVLARSRAGLAFAVLGGFMVFALAYATENQKQRRKVWRYTLGLLLPAMALLYFAVKDDPRWSTMTDKLVGGMQGHALQVACEGTASIEPAIEARLGPGTYTREIIEAVGHGDGTRIIVLRAGLELALKHPGGSDGSREAFRKLLVAHCPQPAVQLLHAHSGWVDMLLAIGWAGAFLYLVVLLAFLRLGMVSLQESSGRGRAWALILVALSMFWILRGLTDSVYRDHMLEMQCFVLAYAAAMVWLRGSVPVPVGSVLR